MKFLCKIGRHVWYVDYNNHNTIRICSKCGKKQVSDYTRLRKCSGLKWINVGYTTSHNFNFKSQEDLDGE